MSYPHLCIIKKLIKAKDKTSISEKLGKISANFIDKPSPQLRKQNKIKTIHSSLRIEGNRLTQEQVTAIIENKTPKFLTFQAIHKHSISSHQKYNQGF